MHLQTCAFACTVWTVSALAAGSIFAAAFSLPFWVAGALYCLSSSSIISMSAGELNCLWFTHSALHHSVLSAVHSLRHRLTPSLPRENLCMLHVEVRASFCVLDACRGVLHRQQHHSQCHLRSREILDTQSEMSLMLG